MLDPATPRFQGLSPFDQLVEIMEALRAPDGCPWDRAQTHQTLTKFLLEETYETLEAIDRNHPEDMCEELGDLLLQIVFHAQMAKEAGTFTIDEVCRSIVTKMIRRHPHIFGGQDNLETPQQVLQQWEQIKLQDKGKKKRASLMEGIPPQLPALLQAERIQGRAAEMGFDWPDRESARTKLSEELAELDESSSEEELGDVLFALVSLARQLGVEAEGALRQTSRKFVERFRRLEERYSGDLSGATPEDLLAAWAAVK